MQKLIFSFLFLCFNLFAQLDWIDSIDEAKELAEKQDKYIMLMLSQVHCDGCWYMQNIVFEDDEIFKMLETNFIPVYLEVDEDEIPSSFSYLGTPTFHFLGPNEDKLGFSINGVKNVKEFKIILEKVLKKD